MKLMKRKINRSLIILIISLILIWSGGVLLAKAGTGNNGQFEITADEMVLEKNKLVATGNVKINSSQGRMTGAKFTLDNSQETGVLTGNPVFKKEGWKIKGNRFEIDFAKEELFVPKDAHIESDTLVADSKQLLFLNQKDQVVLKEEAIVVNEDRRLTGEKVTIDLKTERMTSTGRSKLTLPPKDEDTGAEK